MPAQGSQAGSPEALPRTKPNLESMMAHDHTHAEEDNSGLPRFVGGMALVLLALAVIFAIVVFIGASTHPAYFQ